MTQEGRAGYSTIMASESAPAKRPRVSIDDDASLTGLTLEQLLGMTSHDFFSLHWEKAPLHRHRANTRLPCWNTLPSWSTLLRVIDHASHITESSVLTFKDREPSTEYASAPAAFVDGCSIIVNHVENADESVAVICKGLRESVPHAFCNMYVTPPSAQAVEPHADDRDVIILQLAGKKHWRLWPSAPIPFPMTEEQVGKAGLPVPESVFEEAPLELLLVTGDVLYVPRGFVHEARTDQSSSSLHLTIALPTHDWAWGKVVARILAESNDGERSRSFLLDALSRADCGIDRPRWFWRRSIPPALVCNHSDRAAAKAAYDTAAAVASEIGLSKQIHTEEGDYGRGMEIGVSHEGGRLLVQHFGRTIATHNRRQDELMRVQHPDGREFVTPSSYVRRRRPEEKQSMSTGEAPELRVRAEIADVLCESLGSVTTSPSAVAGSRSDLHLAAELCCEFTRTCFAQVCVDAGLLVLCDPADHVAKDP